MHVSLPTIESFLSHLPAGDFLIATQPGFPDWEGLSPPPP